MGIEEALLNEMRAEANKVMIERIKDGRITLDNDVIPPFLSANLVSNPQMIDILEAMADLIMEETMEKEYVVFFLNKVRELANKERSF
jgi:predicted component of type VI protein secretion system